MTKRKEFLLYCLFGTTATFLYFFARFTTKNLTGNTLYSVTVAQSAAVVFSFFANKFIVFRSRHIGFIKSLYQFFEFCLARICVIFLDLGIAYFFVDKYPQKMIQILHLAQINYMRIPFSLPLISRYIGNAFLLNEFLFTILSKIIATVINYFVSKKVVFHLKEKEMQLVS